MLVHDLFYGLAIVHLCGYDLAHVANFLPCIITTHSKTPPHYKERQRFDANCGFYPV